MTVSSAAQYRYDHITSQMFKEHSRFGDDALAPGDALPNVELYSPDATPIPLRDLAAQNPILLILGSISCPMTASSTHSVKLLYRRFGERVRFVMINVREAHPGERIPQPKKQADKLQNANELQQRFEIPFEVLSDDIDGTLHRMLGGLPNAAFLFDEDGELAFRALWAGDTSCLRQALDAVSRGRTPVRTQSERKLVPIAQGVGQMRDTLERAGSVAVRDVWREAPPMALLASIARFFRPLPPLGRSIAAATTVTVAVASVPVILLAILNRSGPFRHVSRSRKRT